MPHFITKFRILAVLKEGLLVLLATFRIELGYGEEDGEEDGEEVYALKANLKHALMSSSYHILKLVPHRLL